MTDISGKKEYIGKVLLDYSLYPGEDLYSDGDVEDELLAVVKDREPGDYQDVIEERLDWPTLYHLSDARGNIVSWMPFDGTEKVLEIGAGEGAVTGALSDGCAHVTCIDLSRKRSLINAWRHRDRDNIEIKVGNFADIEKTLPEGEYDYIFLIGVLEYAGSYLAEEKEPFLEELRRIRGHLKKDGRVVTAIENRLGMKYFAGCREDHSAVYFDGIEDYPGDHRVRTFSRTALETLFEAAGYRDIRFYYPYPDYKLMNQLSSGEYLPDADMLSDNLRNFDNDRMLLFDEKKAYRGVIRDGLYGIFANSFLVLAGTQVPQQDNDGVRISGVRFSTERAREYRIVTEFHETADGRVVVKRPYTAEAAAHTAGMEEAYRCLSERFEGSQIRICPCHIADSRAVFEWQEGPTLQNILDRCLAERDAEGFTAIVREYEKRLSFNEEAEASDPDMTFGNLIVGVSDTVDWPDAAKAAGLGWTAIDYEWFEKKAASGQTMLKRALQVYFRQDPDRRKRFLSLTGKDSDAGIEEIFGLEAGSLQEAKEEEIRFQQRVCAGRTPLGQMRAAFGKKVSIPRELTENADAPAARKTSADSLGTVQVYTDTGRGYSEEESFFVDAVYQGEGEITFTLKVPEDVKRLRIDPALCPCIVVLREARIGGKTTDVFRRFLSCNGIVHGTSIVFATSDPAMEWDLKKIRKKEKCQGAMDLRFTIMMSGIPSEMAALIE
ncbi:MAG: class I SAM-dependent methyltransferase [Lachnospiraceae bacterium]|nr:class I SAM-dependent methyltransferase [Lachnospiraceae bacterium]